MASLPSYCKVLADGYSEEVDPSIERTQMERGFAKQRIKNTFATVKLTIRVLIQGRANVLAFDSWYYDEIKRIGFFTMQHPRSKQQITCRLLEGKIGSITMVQPDFASVVREFTVEYMRTP